MNKKCSWPTRCEHFLFIAFRGDCPRFTGSAGHHEGMTKYNPHDLRRIAVAALCDPRSVAKVLDGQPVRPMTAQRVLAVLAAEQNAPSGAQRTA